MSILNYLPLLIASVLLFFRVYHFKRLQTHIKETYPNEWDKLCANKMGMNESTAKEANIEESIKSGFLSQQQDSLIVNFQRKDKNFITAMAIFCILQMVMAFFK